MAEALHQNEGLTNQSGQPFTPKKNLWVIPRWGNGQVYFPPAVQALLSF